MLSRIFRPLVARSLYPSPLPRCLNLPIYRRSLTTTATEPPGSEPTLPSSTPAVGTTPKEPQKVTQLPYFVGRNNLENYGVYQKRKRGGNLKLTVLKKAEGDLQALKQDIRDTLQLRDSDVSLNSVTNHIVIRGHKRDEVINFLNTLGF
ncbi:mitochondrial large subunit ribosomal protein-domain-containing protein [Xylariaceae sp. FL0662B]|nr:mitochondrial large subunit ribosomal protein-domain-containing protein [Xylariaceae sp. FL0662B]